MIGLLTVDTFVFTVFYSIQSLEGKTISELFINEQIKDKEVRVFKAKSIILNFRIIPLGNSD